MIPALSAVPLARRTSFRIGGCAREYYLPSTGDELRDVLGRLRASGESPFILGGGSNTLFPDGEFTRPLVSTERLSRLEIRGRIVRAEGGVRLNTLLRTALLNGLSGLEGLVGIPGSTGGAVVMNAGGAGWSFGDRVLEVGLVPLDGGPEVRRSGNGVRWGYRTAHLEGWIVSWVEIGLEEGCRETIRRRMRELMSRKLAVQPLGESSAGCVFRNPEGYRAGELIDRLGLKGLARGGARVSERHANFIVNESGKARAEEVVSLLEEVRDRVLGAFGVRLDTEIVLA